MNKQSMRASANSVTSAVCINNKKALCTLPRVVDGGKICRMVLDEEGEAQAAGGN